MDGSTYPVVGTRPRMQGARALAVGLILVATLALSFTIGRLTARSDDGSPTVPGTTQVLPDLADSPPQHDGVVKQG